MRDEGRQKAVSSRQKAENMSALAASCLLPSFPSSLISHPFVMVRERVALQGARDSVAVYS